MKQEYLPPYLVVPMMILTATIIISALVMSYLNREKTYDPVDEVNADFTQFDNQIDLVEHYLQTKGRIGKEVAEQFSINRLPAVIERLRKRGMKIITHKKADGKLDFYELEK